MSLELDRANANVTWMKDGTVLPTAQTHEALQEGAVYKLRLPKAACSSSGTYTAVVAEGVQSSAALVVNERPVSFLRPLESVTCVEHESVTFKCTLSRENVPVSWTKDGKVISAKEGYTISEDGNECILTIPQTELKSAGTFAVKVAQGAESKATLAVSPLKFVKPLQSKQVKESEAVELQCEVNAENATVTWSMNGKQLKADENFVITQEGAVHKLTIRKSSVANAGTYAAVIKQGVDTKADLHVLESPVTFVRPLCNVECREQDTVTFGCVLSKANAKVTWTKDGKPLSAKQVTVAQQGPVFALTIQNAKTENAGTYTAKVSDTVSSSAKLEVQST